MLREELLKKYANGQRNFTGVNLRYADLSNIDLRFITLNGGANKTTQEMERYNVLLEGKSNGTLSDKQHLELMALRHEMDAFILCKAQAAVLLRWRRYNN